MPVEVVYTPPPEHKCELPRWYQRHVLNIKANTVVRCTECGKLWRWKTVVDQAGPDAYWERANGACVDRVVDRFGAPDGQ